MIRLCSAGRDCWRELWEWRVSKARTPWFLAHPPCQRATGRRCLRPYIAVIELMGTILSHWLTCLISFLVNYHLICSIFEVFGFMFTYNIFFVSLYWNVCSFLFLNSKTTTLTYMNIIIDFHLMMNLSECDRIGCFKLFLETEISVPPVVPCIHMYFLMRWVKTFLAHGCREFIKTGFLFGHLFGVLFALSWCGFVYYGYIFKSPQGHTCRHI